jgi:hypothetical protein
MIITEEKEEDESEKKKEKKKEAPLIADDFFYDYNMMASKASVTEGSGLPEDMLRLKYPLVEFWCLMPLSAIFQLCHGDQF